MAKDKPSLNLQQREALIRNAFYRSLVVLVALALAGIGIWASISLTVLLLRFARQRLAEADGMCSSTLAASGRGMASKISCISRSSSRSRLMAAASGRLVK